MFLPDADTDKGLSGRAGHNSGHRGRAEEFGVHLYCVKLTLVQYGMCSKT